jgi:KDO2-lipid IV(A) lauroyltransferase
LSNAVSDQVVAHNRLAVLEGLGFEGYVESYDVKRYIHEHRDPGRAFLMITDQYPYGGRRGLEVEFLHQKTYTMSAAAALAVQYDMAAVYVRFECREGGGYRMTLIPVSEHAAGEDPAALMQRYYRLLEQDLEAQPWNYLWTHRRWK